MSHFKSHRLKPLDFSLADRLLVGWNSDAKLPDLMPELTQNIACLMPFSHCLNKSFICRPATQHKSSPLDFELQAAPQNLHGFTAAMKCMPCGRFLSSHENTPSMGSLTSSWKPQATFSSSASADSSATTSSPGTRARTRDCHDAVERCRRDALRTQTYTCLSAPLKRQPLHPIPCRGYRCMMPMACRALEQKKLSSRPGTQATAGALRARGAAI